jgi:peptidoglycan/LPS O-acetylase OafA/YrhL
VATQFFCGGNFQKKLFGLGSRIIMNQKIHFPNLDGLRFLAFFFVFMYHCYFNIPKEDEQHSLYMAFHHLWENGDLGVNFFFTLSGFLITYLLLAEEKENGRFSIPHFYWRRTLRIWPLYFTTLLFGFTIFQALVRAIGVTINETANGWYYLLFPTVLLFSIFLQSGLRKNFMIKQKTFYNSQATFSANYSSSRR